jgi:hypothetical protein
MYSARDTEAHSRSPKSSGGPAVFHASVSQAAREALGELGAENSAWVIDPL